MKHFHPILILSLIALSLALVIASSCRPASAEEANLDAASASLFQLSPEAAKRLQNALNDTSALRRIKRDNDDDDATCPAWISDQVFNYPPKPINPVSPFCQMYKSESCCSYEQTFRVHLDFFTRFMFLDQATPILTLPKCFEALESFFCYPCAPNYARFFYVDPIEMRMKWKICSETCEFIFESCRGDPLMEPFKTPEVLCRMIEIAIEETPYTEIDAVIVPGSNSSCFEAIPFDDYHTGPSGCAITWIVFFIVGLLCCCGVFLTVVGYFVLRKYKERREMATITERENAVDEIYKM